MKIIKLLILLLVLGSCGQKGSTGLELHGTEEGLPPELKGLKVYHVETGRFGFINVAILDNKINSLTYPVGKTQQTTLIVNNNPGRVINVSQVLLENDSLIICKK